MTNLLKAIGTDSFGERIGLRLEEGLSDLLGRLGDELRFVLISSYARVHPLAEKPDHAVETDVEGLAVLVTASDKAKCARCWHHREDVGADVRHPEICGRCVENIETAGESRRYA